MLSRLAKSMAWLWFCGVFKKKDNGVSLCKSDKIIKSYRIDITQDRIRRFAEGFKAEFGK